MPQTGSTIEIGGVSAETLLPCGRGRQARIATATLARWTPSATAMQNDKQRMTALIRCIMTASDDMVMTILKLRPQPLVIKRQCPCATQRHDGLRTASNVLTSTRTRHFRTLFISDIHLGARGCQAGKLLDFLRYHEADTIYLVGDIVDGWALKSGFYWPQSHNDVVQKFLRKARKGTRIVYVPGNHDVFLRGYYGTHFGGIEVLEN